MSTRNIVKNIRSSAVIDGKPKLPTTDQLSEGEIAINYAEGYETLSFKNNSNKIVSLSVKTVDDVKVNGSSVVSNKTANITMKGETIPVADTYSTTTFPSPFESKAEHISATDKVDVALKKVETNMSKLVSEVIDNENVVSEAISKLANSAGTIDGSNNITYIKAKNAHYINDATSVHDATVKLDSNVYTIKGDVDTLRGDVNTIKGSINTITSDVSNLGTQVTNLDSKYRNLNKTDINLQGQISNLRATINRLQEITSSIPTMEFVDLDLPSGTLWAKCNIGAATETEYGDYFMWGSVTPNTPDECTWAKAPFNGGNTIYNATAFNQVKDTVCPNGILAKGYDVAYKTTNGAARMPTKADFQELIDNTTNEWFTNFNGTGINGRKFTSKTDTSKYIFIPAAGFCNDGSVNSVGDNGYVWSSSLYTSSPDGAWGLYFSSGSCGMGGSSRYGGQSVRAVRNLPL